MKSNKCANCGANIDLKILTCPYCGSTYAQPTQEKPKATSNFGSFIGDIARALKPIDEALKPVYDEISGEINKGIQKGTAKNQPTAKD